MLLWLGREGGRCGLRVKGGEAKSRGVGGDVGKSSCRISDDEGREKERREG